MKHTQRLLERKNLFLYFALSWTLLITYLSLSDPRILPKFQIQNVDKGVHFVFHFIFTVLWYLYLRHSQKGALKTLSNTFLLSIFYGIVIEICQGTLTTTRSADAMDLIANSIGALSAVFAIVLVQKAYKLIQ